MRAISRLGLSSGLLATLVVVALAGCGRETPEALLAQAKAELAAKETAAAIVRLQSLLQMDPSSAEARFLLGKARLESGDPSGAAIELTRALEQKYDAAQVMPALSQALLLSGATAKLTSAYGNVQLSDKTAAVAYKTHLATAWALLGKTERAESVIAEVLGIDPEYAEARLLQARIAAERKDYAKAISLTEGVIAKGKGLRDAWLLMGEVQAFGLNNLRDAEASLRKSLEADKAHVPSQVLLTTLLIRTGDVAKAKTQFEELRALAPRDVRTTFLHAQFEMADKNYTKARELVQQVLKNTSTNVNALRLASAIEWHLGAREAAARLLETAVTAEPTWTSMRVNLADMYLRLGQAGRAQELVGPLVADNGASAELLGVAAETALQLGRLDQAETLFARAANAKPEDESFQTSLALARLAKGDESRAFRQLEGLALTGRGELADAALVTARLRRQEYDAALAAAESLLKKAPKSPRSHELKGRVLLAQGNLPEARRAFDAAMQLDPASLPPLAAMVEIDFRESQPKQALQRVEAFAKATPSSHLALLLLAEIRLRAGETTESVQEALRQAIAKAPNEPLPRVKLVEFLTRQRQMSAARIAADEAAAALPNDVTVLNALGQTQFVAGDRQQALTTYRRILGLDANNFSAYLRLAELHRASGNVDAATADLQRALELNPGSLEVRNEVANLFIATKRAPKAIELARSIQTRAPSSPGGYLLEADIHRRSKDHAAAASVLRQGLSKAGESQELVLGLYAALSALNDWKQAESLALNWLKKNPNDPAIQQALGEGYIGQRALPAAEARFAKVLSIAPSNVAALNNLAWVMAEQGKPGASKHARRAVELAPTQPAFLDTLAMALAVEGDVAGAIAVQRKAVEQLPGEATMRLRLAMLAVKAGDKALARTELETLLGFAPAGAVREQAERVLKSL